MTYPSNGGPDMDATYNVTANELQQFVEQYEQLESEKKEITDQQKELVREIKGRGYDTKVFKKVISRRKRDKDDLAEEEAILELYEDALLRIASATIESI